MKNRILVVAWRHFCKHVAAGMVLKDPGIYLRRCGIDMTEIVVPIHTEDHFPGFLGGLLLRDFVENQGEYSVLPIRKIAK